MGTRWNSTFMMLNSAFLLKEVFSRLKEFDRNYKCFPSKMEWKVASVLRVCLKCFFDATHHFSGTNLMFVNLNFN